MKYSPQATSAQLVHTVEPRTKYLDESLNLVLLINLSLLLQTFEAAPFFPFPFCRFVVVEWKSPFCQQKPCSTFVPMSSHASSWISDEVLFHLQLCELLWELETSEHVCIVGFKGMSWFYCLEHWGRFGTISWFFSCFYLTKETCDLTVPNLQSWTEWITFVRSYGRAFT